MRPYRTPSPFAIHGLHAADVRSAELRDRNARVAIDDGRHRRRPEQFVAQVLVDELVQVEQVLQQLPAGAEGRRDELDQRLGIVRGDVLVGERGAQRARMRRLRDAAVGRDAQRFLFDALAAALNDLAARRCSSAPRVFVRTCGRWRLSWGPASCRYRA